MSDINKMDIKEFVDLGFLQEANRLFFHPLGLALEVRTQDGDHFELSGIWDYREDLEGMIYAPDVISAKKAGRVSEERLRHFGARVNMFGWPIQPVE